MASFNVALPGGLNLAGQQARTLYLYIGGLVPTGTHEVIISGTGGADAISVWATENAVNTNTPFYGGAVIETKSVQLNRQSATCRVVFTQPFGSPIGIGLQVIIG